MNFLYLFLHSLSIHRAQQPHKEWPSNAFRRFGRRAVTLSWQHSYIVYLFPFVWWQDRFYATIVNTQTDRQLLIGYTISSASWAKKCVLSGICKTAGHECPVAGNSILHVRRARRRAHRSWFAAVSGVAYLLAAVLCNPARVAAMPVPVVRVIRESYAGHLPLSNPYTMIVHSLKSTRQQIRSPCSPIRLGVTWSRTSSYWTVVLQRSECSAVAPVSTAKRRLALRYNSLDVTSASTSRTVNSALANCSRPKFCNVNFIQRTTLLYWFCPSIEQSQ